MDDESKPEDTRSPARRWFDGFFDPDRDPKDKLYALFLGAAIMGACLVVAALLFAAYRLTEPVGQFGDFVGGTLNPVLTFLTFMGLFFTIVMQQQELHAANVAKGDAEKSLKEEKTRVARQQFEYTFFQMLSLHNQIVNSIDLHMKPPRAKGQSVYRYPGKVKQGRDCFRNFADHFAEKFGEATGVDLRDRLQRAYNTFWESRQQDLAHYYRYLYNVLRFVYDHEGIEDAEKIKYVKLLRAQLSDYELVMLFYTALNKHGLNYWKYIHEYEIFDNLPISLLIDHRHKELYSAKSFGEPKMATTLVWPPAVLAMMFDAEKRKAP